MPRLRPSNELEAAQKQIEADLQADLENGATLYGYRQDGAYVARTRDGDRIVEPGEAYRDMMRAKEKKRLEEGLSQQRGRELRSRTARDGDDGHSL